MKTRDKLLLGTIAGTGLALGARAWIRSRRRITLEDRVVVITGASTGHGLFAARQAAKQGARLVIAARDSDDLNAAAADLLGDGAHDVLAVPTDVRDADACHHLIARAIDRHGRVDILINNAGIIQVGPLETMTRDDFEQAMATNFWGAWNCIMAVLPHMREQKFGRIGNVVSVGGKMPVPHLLPYITSKFALAGLTKGLRIELAKDNILVTGVYPSTMRTGGHAHALIKGNEQLEYLMFALSDILPILSTSADTVASALWKGVCNGDAEVLVGWQANIRATLDALFPNWSADSLAQLNRFLPTADGPQVVAIEGENVSGTIPEWLTKTVPEGSRP